MINLTKTKKVYLLLIAVLFVFTSLSSTTYSLFLSSNTVTDLNYNTGLLDLQLVEDEPISLTNFLPIVDSEGVKLKPYNLKIKNIGSVPYLFDLTMVSTNDNNTIDSKYIKVKVNNNLPQNLYLLGNRIVTGDVIYPNEEKTYQITVWLDIGTPNIELGKKYNAKIITSGVAYYKFLDTSGANHPNLSNDMIPVSYNDSTKNWEIADRNNIQTQYEWYNYDSQKWANAVVVKNSNKKIFDLTRKYDLDVQTLKVNNGNIIIDNKYLDIGLKNYNYDAISQILRVKFDDLTAKKIYLLTNESITYYYDNSNKAFALTNGNNRVISNEYNIEKDKWYIIGYTFDGHNVTFYINGEKILTSELDSPINSNHKSFKLGTDSSLKTISKITVGNVLTYNRILNIDEINNNYRNTINIVYNGLLSGYNEFTPMTLKEYYSSKTVGFSINNDDIQEQLVWIPRYKYRLWNILGENSTDSYNAYQTGIDIVFENNSAATGNIYCNNNNCTSDASGTIIVTSNDNNKYYTHPAFRNNNELTGFWVSKYELSTNSDKCNTQNTRGCLSSELLVTSKSNNTVWRNNTLTNYTKAINLQNNHHIISNLEWGAIAYLTHSNYGVCINKTCQNIDKNSTYISGNNIKDSTTGNAYGIFDMAGSAKEYTSTAYNTETYLGDASKEILVDNKLWNGNSYTINTDAKIIIRGDEGIFSFATTNDISADNLTTRFTIK